MKDKTMAKAEWRTVQMFLSIRGIFEVEIDLESDEVRCNCPGFIARNVCKHSRMVVDKARENGGIYPLQVSSKAPTTETKVANSTPEAFRDFVIKYGKIEVM